MKRPLLVSVVLLSLAAVFSAGCATSARRTSAVSRPRSFALAVTVQGGLQPTPTQWAAIQAKVAQSIAVRGWVLVTDISLADHIMRIDFTPSETDPENSGYARLIGIRNNPRSMVARQGTSPYPGSYGFGYGNGYGYSSGMYGWPHSNLYSNSFYGYGDYYNDYSGGSTYYVPVTKDPTPHTPYRHHPGNPADCPPGQSVRPIHGQFAGNFNPTQPVNDHPRPLPRDYGAMRGERVASSSSSSRSSSDRSYSRYDSNNDSRSYFSSSSPSYSSSNYSPSYSSSDSYSAASSSASSSAAAASASSSASSDPVVVGTK